MPEPSDPIESVLAHLSAGGDLSTLEVPCGHCRANGDEGTLRPAHTDSLGTMAEAVLTCSLCEAALELRVAVLTDPHE